MVSGSTCTAAVPNPLAVAAALQPKTLPAHAHIEPPEPELPSSTLYRGLYLSGCSSPASHLLHVKQRHHSFERVQ
jgi:hypothetical protein